MHEVSIIQQVVGTLDAELSEDEKAKVANIIIHVGELSNVQPILLHSAFEAFQNAENKYTQSKMTVEQIPIVIHCDICNNDTRVEHNVFKCKNCGAPSANIITGNELLIHKIEFKN